MAGGSTQTFPREVPPALAGFLCSFFEGRYVTIYYFDALAGAGKTYVLAHRANRLARLGQKVLFVQPTKHLITKTIEGELQPLNPNYPVRAIHSDTVDGVVAEIVAHFEDPAPNGEIVFITHAAFMLVPYFQNRRD